MISNGLQKLAKTAVSLAAGGVLFLSCSSITPPAFDTQQATTGDVLVLQPELRLRGEGGEEAKSGLSDALAFEVRQSLAGRGIPVSVPVEEDVKPLIDGLSRELLDSRARSRRFKPNETLRVEVSAYDSARDSGARSAAFALLSRSGSYVTEDGWVPRPSGELVTHPDDRTDYEIPMRREFVDGGVTLDLLVVDVRSGRVVSHKRTVHPASTPSEIYEAIPLMVRQVTRGLSRSE